MEKRDLFILVVLLFTINSGFVYSASSSQDSYQYNVSNLNMKDLYGYGDVFSGSFYLSLLNAPVDLVFSSDFGKVSLRDFLKANNLPLSCETSNCSDLYNISGQPQTSKSLSLTNTPQKYGLYLQGNSITANSLDLGISANFQEQQEVPISIRVAERYTLKFDAPSTDYSNLRQETYGCFNKTLTSYVPKIISTTPYCQRVNLKSSKAYKIGAELNGSGVADILFILRDNSNNFIASCNISVSSSSYSDTNKNCIVNLQSSLNEGNYSICTNYVAAPGNPTTSYNLKSENVGSNCGYYSSPSVLDNDYSIYVQVPKYASVNGNIVVGQSFNSDSATAINQYIASVYSSNCVSGCVVPIEFSGTVPINLNSVNLIYTSTSGQSPLNQFYDLTKQVRRINFSNYLNIDNFGWKAPSNPGNNTFNLYLEKNSKEKILNKTYSVKALPVILGLYPTTVPAGVNYSFFLDVLNKGNETKYEFTFSPSTSYISYDGFAYHIFQNVSKYNVSVKFGEGNNSVSKSFEVEAINPQSYINESLLSKRAKLTSFNTDLNALPSWYKSYIDKTVKPQDYLNELIRIEQRKNIAYTDQEFLIINSDLNKIIVPSDLFVSDKRTGELYYDYEKINPELVTEISPYNTEDYSEYKPEIFNWHIENTNSSVTKQVITMYDEYFRVNDLITVYDIQITSNYDDESYLIIQESLGSLTFNSDNLQFRNLDGLAAGLVLQPRETVSFSFFVNGSKDVVTFVSPELGSLVVDKTVGVCNFNDYCEKSLGENYKNCSDCKPILPTLIWLIVVLLFALILYTILQVWYKQNYERYLFKERAEMFNLVMYINNAKINGKSSKEIENSLVVKGWSAEQVIYAIRKSEGRNPGMFEIVPVDRVIAYIERNKAKKTANTKLEAPVNRYPIMNRNSPLQKPATGFKQQNFQKVNKP